MKTKLEDIFKVLSNSNRLKILFTIFEKKCCVSEISRISEVSQSMVSQSLSKFLLLELVEQKKNGNKHIYCIRDRKLFKILKKLKNYVEEN